MSKDKDKLNGNSEYTLEDILAEYDGIKKISDLNQESFDESLDDGFDDSHADSNADSIAAEINLEIADDIIDIDTVEDDNIEQDFDFSTKQERVIDGVLAVPSFDESDADLNVVVESDIDTPFILPELSDEDIDTIEQTLSDFTNNIAPEFAVPTAAEAIADSVVEFKEILEDEEVPEEIAKLEPEESDVIYDDEIIDGITEDDTDTEDSDEVSSEISEEISEDVNKAWWKKLACSLFPIKGDGIGEIIRKIIFILATVVFIGAGVMLISTLVQSKRALNDQKELLSMVATTVATSIDEQGNTVTIAPTKEELIQHNYDLMQSLNERFENIIAFIEIKGCDISYPVVQYGDNDYYLTHTYYDGVNKAGAIFLDYRSILSDDYTSPNLVIYGHNQSDGTMFGNLRKYKKDEHDNIDFYKDNPSITLRTMDSIDEYVIYGFFITNTLAKQDSKGEVFRYHDYIEVLKDQDTFKWYMNEILNRSQIISPVDVQFGDQLLLLSTCSNEFSDSRFVVCARKLRDNEEMSDFDFESAKVNYNAKKLDWFAITSGEVTEATTEEPIEVLTLKPKKTKAVTDENGETITTKKTKKTTTVLDGEDSNENSDESGESKVTTVPTDETTTKKSSSTKVTLQIETVPKAETTEGTTTPVDESSQDDVSSVDTSS